MHVLTLRSRNSASHRYHTATLVVMEERLVLKTNAQTNTEFVKGKNAAELGSQGALNFSNAGHSSIIMASEPTIPSHQNMNENPAFNSSGMARERDQMLRNMRLA